MNDTMSRFLLAVALLLGMAALFGQPPAQAGWTYTEDLGGRTVRLDNVAAPGANTDILDAASSTAITWPSAEPGRVTVCLATSSVFNCMLDPAGAGAEFAMQLNDGALSAEVEYTFDLYGLEEGDVLEFQVETDSVIRKLSVGRLKKD